MPYKAPPNEVTLSYNRNAAQVLGNVPLPRTVLTGSLVTVSSGISLIAVIDGRLQPFRDWNTVSDGTGQTYHYGDTFNLYEDTTLYAQYGLA